MPPVRLPSDVEDGRVGAAVFVEAGAEVFGPDRLMAGSDWPVSAIGGLTSFEGWFTLVARLADAAGHAHTVLHGTARTVYGLDTTDAEIGWSDDGLD